MGQSWLLVLDVDNTGRSSFHKPYGGPQGGILVNLVLLGDDGKMLRMPSNPIDTVCEPYPIALPGVISIEACGWDRHFHLIAIRLKLRAAFEEKRVAQRVAILGAETGPLFILMVVHSFG